MALATHEVSEAKQAIHPLLQDDSRVVRYAAATALIAFKDDTGKDLLIEILMTPYPPKEARVLPPALDVKQISDLKLSVLITLAKYNWNILNNTILEVANKDDNISVATKAKEVLNILKK